MRYTIILTLWLAIVLKGSTQCVHLSDSSTSYFNAIIDSLENVYEETKGKSIESLPQSFGHYFWLETDQPDSFIHALESGISIDTLASRYPDLTITWNLLLVRHTIPFLVNGSQRTSIHGIPRKHFDTYELDLDAARIHRHENIEIYWQKYNTYDGKTILCGFWVLEEFKTWQIPASFSDWAHYHDVMTVSEEKLFLAQSKNPSRISDFIPSIIDTLTEYYGEKSGRPDFHSFDDPHVRREAFRTWNENFVYASDSLFQYDSVFRSQLKEGYEFSMNNNRDNDYLIAWVERYYSDEDVLKLMRNNQILPSHSPDMRSIYQKQKMVEYGLRTKNWSVFIKSVLQVGPFSIADTCHHYVPGALENHYIRNLTKLDLDLQTLMLAMLLRKKFSLGFNMLGAEYYSIIPLVRFLDKPLQEEFEKGVVRIIKDENVDPFNKYYFYHAYCEYLSGNLSDSRARHSALMKAEYLLDYLPVQIRANIENPHKALYDLLKDEHVALDSFRIVYHEIVSGPEYLTSYDYWSAMIYDKNEKHRIYYKLYMPIDSVVTPLSNFLSKKDRIRNRIVSNSFVLKLLEVDTTAQLNVQYSRDNAFDPKSHGNLQNMPNVQLESIDFEDAIVFELNSATNGTGCFILLKDNRFMLLRMPAGYSLGKYSFNDLLTVKKEGIEFDGYYSYKIFNEQGEMQN